MFVCWLRRRLRGKERKCPVSPPPAAPATTHHTAAAMADPEQFPKHLDMISLNTQFLFQQSLNFSPQYDRQMRCVHTEQLSMSIWSVSQSSVLLLCKTDMLSFSVRTHTQRICRSHCESRQGNLASPLYQDFQWLLLELRCHPSSDP